MTRAREAEALATRLAASDPFVRALGIELVGAGLGSAAVRLRVRADHLNFNGSAPGKLALTCR